MPSFPLFPTKHNKPKDRENAINTRRPTEIFFANTLFIGFASAFALAVVAAPRSNTVVWYSPSIAMFIRTFPPSLQQLLAKFVFSPYFCRTIWYAIQPFTLFAMYRPLLILTTVFCSICLASSLYAGHDIEQTETIDFYVKEDPDQPSGYGLHSEHSITTVFLSQRSKEWRKPTIGESYYSTVSDISATLDDDDIDKKAITFEYPEDEDTFLSDYKIHTIEFPATLETGQTAAYNYRRDYKGISYFPLLYLDNTDYIKNYTVTIHHPKDIRAEFEVVFSQTPNPYTIDTTDPEKTIFSCANIYKNEYTGYFWFNYAKAWAQVRLYRDKTLLTPSSLPAFTEWYRTLFSQQPVFDEAHDTLLATQIATATSTRAKLEHIHDYVRKTIRYIAEEHSMNAIVPRKPSLVLNRGYGDCKDRAYLVASLARKYDIPNVYMVLICTKPKPTFTGTHMFQYNHAICAWEDNNQVEFFDPTSKYSPLDNIPESDIGRPALILNPDNPRHVVVPPPNRLPSIDVVLTASTGDLKQCTASIKLRNSSLSSAFYALEQLHGVDLENALARLVTPNFHKISFEKFEIQSRHDSLLVLTATADLSRFIVSSPTKKYIPYTPFRTVESDIFEREKDSSTLYLNWRDNLALRIDLNTDGYTGEASSVHLGDIQTTGFSASATPEGNTLRLQYRYAQYHKVFAQGEKQQFLDFCKQYFKLKKNMFTLLKAQ